MILVAKFHNAGAYPGGGFGAPGPRGHLRSAKKKKKEGKEEKKREKERRRTKKGKAIDRKL